MATENYNIKISLKDKQVAALCGDLPQEKAMDLIQSHAQAALSRIADGGLIMYQSHRARIEKVIGPVDDPVQIVTEIERSNRMDGDNKIVSVTLDPVFVGELEEKAEVCGMTVDALLSDLFTTALHMGLFYDMETERIPVFLTPDQHEYLKAKLDLSADGPLTGDAVARKLGYREAEDDIFAPSHPETVGV